MKVFQNWMRFISFQYLTLRYAGISIAIIKRWIENVHTLYTQRIMLLMNLNKACYICNHFFYVSHITAFHFICLAMIILYIAGGSLTGLGCSFDFLLRKRTSYPLDRVEENNNIPDGLKTNQY